MQKQVDALAAAIAAVAPRFESANNIPVEKATVPTVEWLNLMMALRAISVVGMATASAAQKYEKLTCEAVLAALVDAGVIRENTETALERYRHSDSELTSALAMALRQMNLTDVSDSKLSELLGGY